MEGPAVLDWLLAGPRSERTRHRAEPFDWVRTPPLVDAGPGRIHRSVIAHALIVVLAADLVDRVPSGRTYARRQARSGRQIVLDHVAVRTVAAPSGALPAGIDQVRRILEPLGWQRRETYPLPSLSMTGTSWAHDDAPTEIAQWFVSEFHPDEFDPAFRATVDQVLATSVDPLTADAVAALDALAADHHVDERTAVELLPVLAACFGRHHRLPTSAEYDRLVADSPEMAWIATEGTTCNHVTDRVVDVAAVAEEERISGRPVKDSIEVSASGLVRQTAHRAAVVRRTFVIEPEGDTEPEEMPTTIERSVPGSFFEFIQRDELPDGSGIDLAFDAANATGIFAMTRRDDTTTAQHGGPAETAARAVARPSFTFKVRRRQLSPKRRAEFEEWIGRWGVPLDGPPLDWDDLFDRSERSERRNGLDIGFGHGESTTVMARNEPELDVIGVEVHDPGVATVLAAIEQEPLRNIRVVHGDLIRFLRRVEADSLDVIRIFFPDPWNKARQRHRRLVRPDVVAALTDRLRPGGELHLATDIADYAEEMREACDDEPRLDGGVIPRPANRPLTRFEQRGIDEGRQPVDLRYHRVTGH